MAAVPAEEMPVILKIQERIQVPVRPDNDISAFSSVPAVRNSFSLKFITVETLAASPAAAAFNIYLCPVNKHLLSKTLSLVFLAASIPAYGLYWYGRPCACGT